MTMKNFYIFMIAGIMLFANSPIYADSDHERAKKALESGQVLPLQTILQKISKDYPGQVLEVELDQEKGVWIYEIKQLSAKGTILKLDIDAKTGQVLKQKLKKNSN